MNIRPLLFLAGALLIAAGSNAYAQYYYLKDDGSRWRTTDGQPLQGAHKASTLICKDNSNCYALIYAGRGLGGWRQRGPMWAEIQQARRQLEEAETDRVELAPETGRRLYSAAREGYWRSLSDE